MHKSRLSQIVIDCKCDDLDQAAAFWGAALGRPAESLQESEDANYRQLGSAENELNILLQKVDHASRVHLDMETDNVEAEVQRLEALGARRVEQVKTWWVMEAPTGQRFCVLEPQTDNLDTYGNRWE
jgi:hypothetical protein